MQTPQTILEWLTEKVESHHWASVREPRTVSHSWKRHTGGRTKSAALSASIEPSHEFQLLVEATNVEGEFIQAAKNAALTVLLSQSWSPVIRCTISLFAFQPHEHESSYAAFYEVAREATEQLLGVAPGFVHNIEWSGENGA